MQVISVVFSCLPDLESKSPVAEVTIYLGHRTQIIEADSNLRASSLGLAMVAMEGMLHAANGRKQPTVLTMTPINHNNDHPASSPYRPTRGTYSLAVTNTVRFDLKPVQ